MHLRKVSFFFPLAHQLRNCNDPENTADQTLFTCSYFTFSNVIYYNAFITSETCSKTVIATKQKMWVCRALELISCLQSITESQSNLARSGICRCIRLQMQAEHQPQLINIKFWIEWKSDNIFISVTKFFLLLLMTSVEAMQEAKVTQPAHGQQKKH